MSEPNDRSPQAPSAQPQPGGFRSVYAQDVKLAPGPRDAKSAVREGAIDALYNVRAIAEEFIEDFRNSDRFFKYKAGVVASWCAMTLLTLVLACPSAQRQPTNSLRASVSVMQVPGLETTRTALLIENQSDAAWDDVMLKLNGTWTAAIPTIAPRQRAVIELKKFSAADGKTPPIDLRPTSLEIRSSEGKATIDNLVAR
ncbi:MAG: hypothetical protein ACK4N5_00030 [Myxococcales bacterium]